MIGMSKSEKVAIPPEARNAVVMLRIWVACIVAILFTVIFSRGIGNAEEMRSGCAA
jgi:hypothetical protein